MSPQEIEIPSDLVKNKITCTQDHACTCISSTVFRLQGTWTNFVSRIPFLLGCRYSQRALPVSWGITLILQRIEKWNINDHQHSKRGCTHLPRSFHLGEYLKIMSLFCVYFYCFSFYVWLLQKYLVFLRTFFYLKLHFGLSQETKGNITEFM